MDTFLRLFTEHKPALERFVRFRIRNPFDAEDIIQETCLRAYRSFSALKDPEAFKPWVLRIARNQCNDYFRRLAKTLELPVDEFPENRMPYGRMGVTVVTPVEETLQRLGSRDQQILYLYYFRDIPQAAIARRLGIPLGTVKSRLHTAKANFKALYPHDNPPKGEIFMEKFPTHLPAYTITPSQEPPFAVRFEELMGWFIVPRLGESCAWAQYDMPGRAITDIYTSSVEKEVILHGIPGVEIRNTHHKAGSSASDASTFYFIAQLTEETCRWLGNRYSENGVEHIITFLDGDEFLQAWGSGDNNIGEPVQVMPRGRITRDGDALQARPGSVTDCVGRYTVELGGRCYDTDLLVGIFHDGPLTEQYIDARGRTVLWRRFNRDDWALERYGETWSQRFPENQRITVNGVLYVHWYDCISRDILG